MSRHKHGYKGSESALNGLSNYIHMVHRDVPGKGIDRHWLFSCRVVVAYYGMHFQKKLTGHLEQKADFAARQIQNGHWPKFKAFVKQLKPEDYASVHVPAQPNSPDLAVVNALLSQGS